MLNAGPRSILKRGSLRVDAFTFARRVAVRSFLAVRFNCAASRFDGRADFFDLVTSWRVRRFADFA